MAISLVAGLSAVGGAMITAGKFAIGFKAAFGAFAMGAGLSSLSRALAPKPNMNASMRGQTITNRDPVGTRKVVYGKTRVGGNIVFMESTSNDDLYLVIAIAGHEIESYEAVYFNEQKVYENGAYFSDWDTYIDLHFYYGTDTQTANNALVTASNNKWTTAHTLNGVAYLVVKLTYDQDKFATGLPNISCIIKGKKVLNKEGTATAWTDNAALIIADYLRDTKYGLGESASNIDSTSIETAHDICDQDVNLSGSGSQKRYTVNGVIDTATPIKDNIELLLGSMSGRLIFTGGKFQLFAGNYVAPTVTLSESDVAGEISIATKQSRRSQYNVVKGAFISEEENYTPADYPSQRVLDGSGNNTYATQDNEQILLDLPLPFVTNNVRAQRLARIALQRSRQQRVISIPFNLSALKFKVGDNINITNTRLFGNTTLIFEVLGYNISFGSDRQLIVNVEARETNSNIYTWNQSEVAFLGASTVSINDGQTVAAPTITSITNDTFFNADGTFSENVIVNFTNSASAFIDHYVLQYRVDGDNSAPYFEQQTNASPFIINNVRNGTTYDIRIKAVNELNVSSAFAETTHTTVADTTAPAAPTNLAVTNNFKSINVTWTNPTDADFSHVEIHRASGLVGGNYSKVGESSGTLFIDTDLAFGTNFNYKVRSVDFSGNVSAFTSQNNLASSAARIASDEITSLSVQKLTGDVTEVYPFSQYYNATLTASESTIGTFTLPTPTLSISKRQKIDIVALFEVQNDGLTAEAKRNIFFSIQKKSKGVNAIQIGATNGVVSESFPHTNMQLISVSGNHLESIDSSGGVAKTNDASGSNEPATINSVYYDSASNKTFVLIGGLFTFSTNDTLFYSDSKFFSAGTWVLPSATEAINVITPPDPDINYVNATTVSSGVGKSRFYLPFQQSYGQTNTETNYRVRAKVSTLDTGITYKIIRAKGTLENIA